MSSAAANLLEPFRPPDAEAFNFRAGALFDGDEALVLAGVVKLEADETPHTVVLRWRRGQEWRGTLVDWSAGSVCAIERPGREGVLVGSDGEYAAVRGEECHEGRACDGLLSGVSNVAGTAVACGSGAILRYDGRTWAPLPCPGFEKTLLRAAAGTSAEDFYAVGWKGSLAKMTANGARRIDSPTNVILTSVCLAPDGFAYACGQQGILLRGRDDAWSVIDHGVTTENLWDVHAFQGRVFVASVRFLYELKGETLERVRFAEETPSSFYQLSAASETHLLSVGKKDVFLYDGSSWTNLLGE